MAGFARLWTTFTGRRVIGLTTSTNAARVLAHEGLAESYNIAQFLGKTEGSDELRRPVPLYRDDVLVLDEASQLSTDRPGHDPGGGPAGRSAGRRHRRYRAARRGRSRGHVPTARAGGPRHPAARGPPVRCGLGTGSQHPAPRRRPGHGRRLRPARPDPRRRCRSRLRPGRHDVARRPPARQGRAAARRVQRRSRRPIPPRPGQAHPARQRRPAAGPAVGRQPRRRRRPGPRPPEHRDRRGRRTAHQPRHPPDHRIPRPRRRSPAAAAGRDLDRALPGAQVLPGQPRRARLRRQRPRRPGPHRRHRPPPGHRHRCPGRPCTSA